MLATRLSRVCYVRTRRSVEFAEEVPAVQRPTTQELELREPAITISMCDDLVVICPPSPLGLDSTHALVAAAAAGVLGGSMVMIDLDGETDSSELVALGPISDGLVDPTAVAGHVGVVGAGCVRLSTADSYWTIDISEGRLFRAETIVDHHFVGRADWTSVQAIWLTCSSITALCADGSYISARVI